MGDGSLIGFIASYTQNTPMIAKETKDNPFEPCTTPFRSVVHQPFRA